MDYKKNVINLHQYTPIFPIGYIWHYIVRGQNCRPFHEKWKAISSHFNGYCVFFSMILDCSNLFYINQESAWNMLLLCILYETCKNIFPFLFFKHSPYHNLYQKKISSTQLEFSLFINQVLSFAITQLILGNRRPFQMIRLAC